ncbi:hypothetical protein D3C76_1545880 [compost metagenome]
MALIFRQRRVIQLFHQRLVFQELDNRLGVTLRHFHTRRQRTQTAQQQIAVERATSDANVIGPPCQFGDNIRIFCNHHPGDHVRVAVQIFGA